MSDSSDTVFPVPEGISSTPWPCREQRCHRQQGRPQGWVDPSPPGTTRSRNTLASKVLLSSSM